MIETNPEVAQDTQQDSATPPPPPNVTSKSPDVAAPASQTPPQQSASQSSVPRVSSGLKPKDAARQSDAEVWRLKELQWPPDDETRPVVRIITQNENGPCGLIALCELLKGKVRLW